jgi:uncharacterized caspase-like protein
MDRAGTNVNIVFLDACRDNPFHRRFRSTSRGLSQMDATKGTFIAYSTAPGQLAHDGPDQNSPFTAQLLAHIATPNIPIEKLLKLVRLGVIQETAGRQMPWQTSSLIGDFYFNWQE